MNCLCLVGSEGQWVGRKEPLRQTRKQRRAGKKKKDELINKDSESIPTRLTSHCSMLRDTDFLEVCSNSSLHLEVAVNVRST